MLDPGSAEIYDDTDVRGRKYSNHHHHRHIRDTITRVWFTVAYV